MARKSQRGKMKETREPNPGFSFRWQNFRSFEDTGWLEIRPVTILIGANNSGKTSLIRPLLLLKQTLESRDPNIPLKTTGPLADVGRFGDFVFAHERRREVVFSLRFHNTDQAKSDRKPKPVLSYPPEEMTVRFRSRGTSPEIQLSRFTARDAYGRQLLARQALKSPRYSLTFPAKLGQDVRKLAAESVPSHFLFQPHGLLGKLIQGTRERGKGKRRSKSLTLSWSSAAYLSTLQYVSTHAENLASRLSYVGPLREHPRRFYQAKEEVPPTVGLRGEDAAQVLFLKRDREFRSMVDRWLQELGVAGRVRCTPDHEGLFALEVRGPGKRSRVNLADTGFGLSQVLPLVVQAFHSERRSIMFFEQPEIHLNPKLQCQMSNLLAAIVGEEKVAIVETHSEHLVLRLRSLIAEHTLRPEDVALYFVERQEGRSTVRRIPIRADGSIDSNQWPEGFFEESLGEALRLARPLLGEAR